MCGTSTDNMDMEAAVSDLMSLLSIKVEDGGSALHPARVGSVLE